MAKRRAKRPEPVPLTVGDVFAMPLADGRYGACRVLRARAANDEPFIDRESTVVAATQFIGDAPPSLDEPALRRVLVLSHHCHGGTPEDACTLWLEGPPPATFTRIGNIEPTPAERTIPCNSASGWPYFPVQVLMQWRWDNERDAVFAEDAAEEAAEIARRAEGDKQRRAELDRMTYASFRAQKLFAHWSGHVPKQMIAESRKLMRQTATRLEKLGPKPDRDAARAILRDCILAFNRLDDGNDHWIATIEREDICEHFYELAHLAGFDDEPELADEWRDW
jgi:hypothetical protein